MILHAQKDGRTMYANVVLKIQIKVEFLPNRLTQPLAPELQINDSQYSMINKFTQKLQPFSFGVHHSQEQSGTWSRRMTLAPPQSL